MLGFVPPKRNPTKPRKCWVSFLKSATQQSPGNVGFRSSTQQPNKAPEMLGFVPQPNLIALHREAQNPDFLIQRISSVKKKANRLISTLHLSQQQIIQTNNYTLERSVKIS